MLLRLADPRCHCLSKARPHDVQSGAPVNVRVDTQMGRCTGRRRGVILDQQLVRAQDSFSRSSIFKCSQQFALSFPKSMDDKIRLLCFGKLGRSLLQSLSSHAPTPPNPTIMTFPRLQQIQEPVVISALTRSSYVVLFMCRI